MKTKANWRNLAAISVIALATGSYAIADNDSGKSVDWPFAGKNLENTHYASDPKINLENIMKQPLKVKFTYTLDSLSGVSATPAVVNEVVYFPDWGGNIQAIHAETGKLIWKKSIKNYSLPGKEIAISRSTPVYSNGVLYVGSNDNFGSNPQNGAVLLAINAKTGALIWSTLIDNTSRYSIITQAPTVYDGVVYVGTSSLEEATGCAINNSCSFRGSLVALDSKTGAIKFKTYMTKEGFSGASVWGGQPTLDIKRKSIYIATGNNYTAPTDSQGNALDDPTNLAEAIVALDMKTGAIKWSQKMTPEGEPDVFTMLCFNPAFAASCGPDYDFGQSPMLIEKNKNLASDIVAAGQKSGIFFGLNPDNGQILWTTPVGPGSALGGMEWGSATDGKYIYATDTNYYGIPYTLVNPAPNSLTSTTGGFWTALDPADGHIVWQSADPDKNLVYAGVSSADGVVFGGSASGDGTKSGAFAALNSDTGEIVWSYKTGLDDTHTGAVVGSPAIVKGKLYWGAGFTRIFTNATTNLFYAFSINGKDEK